MGLFDRFRRSNRACLPGVDRSQGLDYLRSWAARHRGIEAYLEPRTSVTETTVVLVADDGEWTRRRVHSPRAAYDLGREIGIPVYEVLLVGYPRRMREYTARRARQERDKRRAAEG